MSSWCFPSGQVLPISHRRCDGFVVLSLAEVASFAVAELEAELGAEFFRVNREYLVCAAAVAGFRPHAKGKLLVELAPPPPGEVIVSQDNAARFRAWLAG
jgi:hypothetical protein